MCVSYEDAHVVDEKEEGRMVDDHCEMFVQFTALRFTATENSRELELH